VISERLWLISQENDTSQKQVLLVKDILENSGLTMLLITKLVRKLKLTSLQKVTELMQSVRLREKVFRERLRDTTYQEDR